MIGIFRWLALSVKSLALGTDEAEQPAKRLPTDGLHFAVPFLSGILYGVLPFTLVSLALGGKQIYDGWKPGRGVRGGSVVDFVLVVLGSVVFYLWSVNLGLEAGALTAVVIVTTLTLRGWQQENWTQAG